MKIKIILLMMCFSSLLFSESFNVVSKINELYRDISGFGIAENECAMISTKGGNATYGEITAAGLKTLLDDLKLTACDRFYDLGSGVGKACVQVYLSTPAAKVVGIELSPTRHAHAQNVKQKMFEKKLLKRSRRLECIEQNILDTNLDDATVIYMASTCFSENLMKQLTEKFSKIKHDLRIITLKQLPDNDYFVLEKTYQLPMTWSAQSPVYLYRSKKKIVQANNRHGKMFKKI